MMRKRQGRYEGEVRFRLSLGQVALALSMFLTLLIFTNSTLATSRESVKQAQILTNAETPAASIIFTQRESLVYVVRYSEWLSGSIERRQLQIARALLAQRLSVVDSAGTAIGSRLNPEFLTALKKSDEIVASAPKGILPESLHQKYLALSGNVIDDIVANARTLIVSYQQSVTAELKAQALNRERDSRKNLGLLFLLIALTTLFLVWIGISGTSQYRRFQKIIQEEKRDLTEARDELLLTRESLIKLTTLNEAKNEFVATVNHELRTPLTSIIGYIAVLRKRLNGQSSHEEIVPIVDTLDRNATALIDLVESMLSISRLDSNDFVADFNKIDLVENLQEVLFILQPNVLQKNIGIEINGRKDEFIIDGNHGQISQVFLNVISNAIKFSPEKSTINITFNKGRAESNLDVIYIKISDHGIGIPPEDLDKLFTRFFRAKNAVEGQVPGTGLGLAIVQKIVLLHGGVISAESELGEGTTFQITFPEALNRTDQLISARKIPVLNRSIQKVNEAENDQLASVSHEVGGAIGFYSFLDEGAEISRISRELHSRIDLTNKEISDFKGEILQMLLKAKDSVEREGSK